MNTLIFANLPHDCLEQELQQWVEERGFVVTELRVIRDSVSSSSPSFARIRLADLRQETLAVEMLNSQELRGRKVVVRCEQAFARFAS